MRTKNLTIPEIETILAKANFSQRELQFFTLRNQEKSLEECAEEMNLSLKSITRLRKEVRKKISKILHISF